MLTRANTLELLWSTGLLVAGVTAASVTIGVSVAWLVTRTDLPGRRLWAVGAALPLVIPSYVAAFCLLGAFGPRGLLQQLLGVERLPEIYGYWGALAALTLSTYPYVLLLVSAALRGLDPSLEEAGRGLGQTPFAVFRRVTLPALRPSIGAGALLVALYALSDFGVVSLMRYDALTRAIYLQYRSLFDRTPAAMLALVLVALTALVLLLEGRWRRRVAAERARHGAAAAPAPARPLALARARLLRDRRRRLPRRAGGGARLLARARARPRRAALARGGQLDVGVGARGRRRRGGGACRSPCSRPAGRRAGRGCSSGCRSPATRCPES